MTAVAATAEGPKFTTGSTLRHVSVMTATGSLGLIAVFFVDALNLFYISLLGQQELAAAIGFAGTFQFFLISVSIGLAIATSALVSRALGRGARAEAASLAGAAMAYTGLASFALVAVIFPFIDPLVGLLGATGETRAIAVGFLRIVLPSVPLITLGMAASGVLRAVGDARRAMNVTLGAGAAAAVLDPIFIFGLDLGVTGAAISTVLSRSLLLAIGLWGVLGVHRLVARPRLPTLAGSARPFFAIALPAILTQLATPFGNAYVTAAIAGFGDEAVAGWAVIGRVLPVAFGAIFALSGAVGPIVGQNVGAGRYDRVRATIKDSLTLTLVYVVAVWALLALFRHPIAGLFGATGEAAALIVFFCLFAAGSFLFNGALFVANAAFNNLGYAGYSTIFNWGRATLGVIPFVWIGAQSFGAVGVIAGWGLGAVVFGTAAMVVCLRLLRRLERDGGEGGGGGEGARRRRRPGSRPSPPARPRPSAEPGDAGRRPVYKPGG
jgi:putative MATE family efflux protein